MPETKKKTVNTTVRTVNKKLNTDGLFTSRGKKTSLKLLYNKIWGRFLNLQYKQVLVIDIPKKYSKNTESMNKFRIIVFQAINYRLKINDLEIQLGTRIMQNNKKLVLFQK